MIEAISREDMLCKVSGALRGISIRFVHFFSKNLDRVYLVCAEFVPQGLHSVAQG
jgi:hypothetical protein